MYCACPSSGFDFENDCNCFGKDEVVRSKFLTLRGFCTAVCTLFSPFKVEQRNAAPGHIICYGSISTVVQKWTHTQPEASSGSDL